MIQQINLYTADFLPRSQQFSLPRMLAGLALILLGALGMYAYAVYQVGQLDAQVSEGERRVTEGQARFAQLSGEFAQQNSEQALQAEVSRLERQAADRAGLVEAMSRGVPAKGAGYSGYMRAFARQAVDGLWLTGFSVGEDGEQVGLRGGVTNPELLPEYIRRLGGEDVMRGKTFSELQMKQVKADGVGVPDRYVEFSLHSGAAAVQP